MSLALNKALEMVKQYIDEVNLLLAKSYKEGKHEKKGLIARIEQFISLEYPYEIVKLFKFQNSLPIRSSFGSYEKSESKKQAEYLEDLNIIKNYLLANKEEIKYKMPLDTNEKSLAENLFDDLITHPLIKKASQSHFKNENYRPAVLDAMIRLEVMVKEKANFPKDNKGKELSGHSLMHKVFDPEKPILSWCEGSSQTEKDELAGYKLIFAGVMLGIRNPKAHALVEISPPRALKLLTLATLLAELVDVSKYVKQD